MVDSEGEYLDKIILRPDKSKDYLRALYRSLIMINITGSAWWFESRFC